MKTFILFLIALIGLIPDFFAQTEILEQFYLDQVNGRVRLNWSIKSGNTCNGIDIERSEDSLYFQKTGDIEGTCGSSISVISYSFTDENPILNKKSYYRLKLGGSSYSQILSIEVIDVSANNYLLRPNPISESGQLYFKNDNHAEFDFIIYNQNGEEISRLRTTENLIIIKADDFLTGLYFFHLLSIENKTDIKGKIQIID